MKLKASLVRNPVLSIIYKLLANIIFASYDRGSVRTDDLNLLFQELKHIVRDEEKNLLQDDFGDDWNLGCIFAKELNAF